MEKKPRRSGKKARVQEGGAQLELVEDFLSHFAVEEVSFESWQECHTNLDVIIPVFLDAQVAASGARKSIKFTRTCQTNSADGTNQRSKEEVSIDVDIPPNSCSGERLVLQGLGDRIDESRGRLIVEVRVRKP